MLAGGVDHQVEMVAAVGDHEIVFEPALVIGEQPVALAAGFEIPTSTGVMVSSASAASRTSPLLARIRICPMCETSNSPALARVCRCSCITPIGYWIGMS
jgi:hypothetical protein